MHLKFYFLLLSSIIFLNEYCTATTLHKGTNYYFDANNGNDNNNGLSANEAWKSLSKAKELKLEAGDSILLCRESVFIDILDITAQGTAGKRIVIDAYGKGKKPCITAPDNSLYTIRIWNSDYVTLQNLEVINTGMKRLARRTGVKVQCENYGVSHHIILNALDIHDVNGSLIKHDGGGSGILIQNKWSNNNPVSIFDSLTIENCAIRRCERNGIIWSAPWSRKNWHLSTNTIVRKNLIEEVPGDGIVPIGCNGALVEYNLMRKCPALLPDGEAAAGIWPWSCDNTIIQFNEVSDHKAPWDGQGFDSDYNCTNTIIQYNYSHNNDGGFILICNAGQGETNPKDNIGNKGSVIRHNISINDAVRQRKTRAGIFSPTIHISGPCKNTLIEYNILYVGKKPSAQVDRKIITSDSWGGYADSTTFRSNIFYALQPSVFNLTQSTNNSFEGNYYLGTFTDKPVDTQGSTESVYYNSQVKKTSEDSIPLSFLFKEVEVGDGMAMMRAVKKETIQHFFKKMK
ncbi:MAG: right-handed parallel beta-helix repeat-containing protein [Bacteroides xylanisolvens]